MNGGLCFLGPNYKTKNKKRRSVVPKESYMNINTGSTTVTKKKKRHQLLHTGNSIADSDIKKQLPRTDTRVLVFLVYFSSTRR